MKKLLFIFTAIFFTFAPLAFAHKLETPHTPVTGENINYMDAEITVGKDGTINVKESIFYDFADLERHGIYRNIPFTKRNEENKRVDLKFSDFKVTGEDGTPYKFEQSTEGEEIVLKIGDPDKYVTGQVTYVISYKVAGALGYFNDYDEIYWNVTGNGWEIPIQEASAHINLPPEIDIKKVKRICFTGSYGSENKNCDFIDVGRVIHIHTTNLLNPYEGLTIAIGFPKNVVAYLPPEVYVSFWETIWGKLTVFGIALLAFFWYLVLPVILIIRYYRSGRDPDVGVAVTAWYEPPQTKSGRKISPTETGGLVDESVDARDIFAAIIDLARRGYVTIKEYEKKKFSLIYTNKPHAKDKLLPFEQHLLDGIFDSKTEVKLKDVKFYKTVQNVEKEVYENLVTEGYFNTNPKTTRAKYYALGAVALTTFNIVLAFVAFLFGRFMPRKTLFGAQSANVGRGIKNFLTSQERELNYQGNKQLFFEKLLPFAVAFGVEKNWAERFKDFDLRPPDWYQGASSSHFSSAVFANSLSDSYKGFSASSTPPSSSSSGFSGGSSGGGGGGGGGGSW